MTDRNLPASWRIAMPALILLCVLLVVLYSDTTRYLARLWSDWSEGGYSHGFIVLLLSGYIIYSKRHMLVSAGSCPALVALPLLALCVVIWTLAGLANTQLVQALVLLPLLLALAWSVAGLAAMRQLLLPVLLIGLAIPVWSPLLPFLQVITAESAYWLARTAGIPAFLEDFTIYLPSGRLSIEDACSGLHYLLAGLTLGVFYAWLNYCLFSHRILVVVLAVGASILANILRVFIITWLAHQTAMQHPYVEDHLSLGWYLFGALLLVLLAADLLFGSRAQAARAVPAQSPAHCRHGGVTQWVVVCLSAALIAAGPLSLLRAEPIISAQALVHPGLPTGAGGWRGPLPIESNWRPLYHGALTKTARYDRGGAVVDLFVGHYPRQRQGTELINELNRIANEDTWEAGTASVTVGGACGPVVIEVELDSLYAGRRLVWYRYRVAGQYTTGAVRSKLLQVAGMLAGRPDASIIAVSTGIREDAQAARGRLADFMCSIDESLLRGLDENN